MPVFLRALPVLLVLLLPACGLAGLTDDQKFDTPVGDSMAPEERALAFEVLDRLNAERAAHELPPLAWNEAAADVGYDHCIDMRVRGFYAHSNPDGMGACDRMRAAGVEMTLCGGENIARNNETAHDVVNAWMASQAHRDLLLAPTFTHVGVGVHTGSGGPWWALEFLVRLE